MLTMEHQHRNHVRMHDRHKRDWTGETWKHVRSAVGDAWDEAGDWSNKHLKNGLVQERQNNVQDPAAAPPTPTSTLPTAITSTGTIVPGTSILIDTALPTTSSTSTRPVVPSTSATRTAATSSATASSTPVGDDTAGAKAGIVLGALAGVLVVFTIVYLALRKRRKSMEKKRRRDDEKKNGPFADSNAIKADEPPPLPTKAPRLSLRPVTQFFPSHGQQQQQKYPDRRASRGANIALATSPNMSKSPDNSSSSSSTWDNQTSRYLDPANPFGDNAERRGTPNAYDHAPVSPISEYSEVGTAMTTRCPSPDSMMGASSAGVAGTAGVAAAASSTRRTSMRKDAPDALDLTLPPKSLGAVPPSPAGTEFSMHSIAPGQSTGPSASSAAIAAAGGPPTSSVHRVQLDFKPTLEDELGLKAGQLVRLLHEYDDGWALCIRLDRSQQGVVPRTCLSTRPVKPRPGPGGSRSGPPVNPSRGANGPRPESPMRPMGRPQSPAGRPMSPGPRAQSPGPRYQQHQQQQGGRSQSPSGGGNRRPSPPGPSQMSQQYQPHQHSDSVGHKPMIPGQAY